MILLLLGSVFVGYSGVLLNVLIGMSFVVFCFGYRFLLLGGWFRLMM